MKNERYERNSLVVAESLKSKGSSSLVYEVFVLSSQTLGSTT